MQRICKFYAAGNCNKEGCTFLHQGNPGPGTQGQMNNQGGGAFQGNHGGGFKNKNFGGGGGGFQNKYPERKQFDNQGFQGQNMGNGPYNKQNLPYKSGYQNKSSGGPGGYQNHPSGGPNEYQNKAPVGQGGFKKTFEPRFCDYFLNNYCNKQDCK